MKQSDLLSYVNPGKDLETDGFRFNPYEPCVANKIIRGYPPTVVLHVNDVKASHKDIKAVENFEQWIEFMYGYPDIGDIKSLRRKVHEYFSVTLYYTTKGEVEIDMQKPVKT